MKKALRSVPSLKILLLSYAALFVLLVVVRNFQYWSIKNKSTNLIEVASNSTQRQSTLSAIQNANINEQHMILNLLYYPGKSRDKKLEELISKIKSNDSLLVTLSKIIKKPQEQRLFDKLQAIARIKTGYQNTLFQLIRSAKYDEAVMIYNDTLSVSYSNFQQQNRQLLNFFTKSDNTQIGLLEKQISNMNYLNKWISAALILLIIFLITTYIKMLKLIRKTNVELKESERRYRNLIEQTNEIIEKCDASGKFIFTNDSFKKKLEYNEAELSHLTISDILAEGSLTLDQYSKSTEVIKNVQKVFKSKSGKRIYIEGTILLEFNNGNFTGSIGFFNDVTEKKMLEESLITSELKFRDFFNLAPIPMWAYDSLTYRFVIVNKASLKHYGYTEEEFLNMTIMDLRHEEDNLKEQEDNLNTADKNTPATKNETGKSNYTHLKKDGEKIDVEIHTSPIIINGNKCILTIANDVTERNQHENKITKAIIKTQEDERYEIGSELHDNVCQLLAAAKMNLGILKPSLEPPVITTYNHARESINLALAEIRNLSHRLAPAFFDNTRLDEAFDNLLRTFNVENKYDISLYFNNTAMNYQINPEMQLNLYRILQEQLRNIIEYAKGTSIEVGVFIYNNKLKMRIADDGVGFDVNSVKKGIGLANIKRRAELFSGKLQVNSEPGKGCELLITIPMNEIN
jgi:PAS domain S-box-containing protein